MNTFHKALQHGTIVDDRYLAGKNDLTDFPASGRELIFQDCDLEARFDLMDRAQVEYESGNFEGFGALFHAEMYLKGRRGYECNRPPFRTAIPADFLYPPITEAIQ